MSLQASTEWILNWIIRALTKHRSFGLFTWSVSAHSVTRVQSIVDDKKEVHRALSDKLKNNFSLFVGAFELNSTIEQTAIKFFFYTLKAL